MKHSNIFSSIVSKIESLENNEALKITNFHPDLFGSLLSQIKKKVYITISDDSFSLVIKHLAPLWEDDSVAFVGNPSLHSSPKGFLSEVERLFNRSKALLGSGVDVCRVFLVSESGSEVPIVGSTNPSTLDFKKDVSYDICCRFLVEEKYTHVDCVSYPGEYSKKGGIIDVFSYSSSFPVRINFLDDVPVVFRFDVDTQLTVSIISAFHIMSLNAGERKSLSSFVFKDYLSFSFSSGFVLTVGNNFSFKESINIEALNHSDFCSLKESGFRFFKIFKGLTSLAVKNDDGSFLVPKWFIDKNPLDNYKKDSNSVFSSVLPADISVGDFFVHRDHGVAKCVGLSVDENEEKQEFIMLKYADDGLISIDVSKLNLISFFANADEENIVLDSLSKKGRWLRKKESAKKQAQEAVASLLNLYVQRKKAVRSPFIKDQNLEATFLSSFPYKDTPDQVAAWQEISKDLNSKIPMDRLLCGDVGFGKTEIAIRAAFRVVVSGMRVIVLAPTTILANQLYSSFSTRLKPFAMSVDIVSRFKSNKNLQLLKNSIIKNQNDVLIGTHSILNDDIYIKNTGLVIIDEEHRFGVKQKEKIKECRYNVDVLSMSATPIPRSINLALSDVYTMSLLQTPPLLRKPIYTEVCFFTDSQIKSIILFEISRGGQVFFVHNNVKTIINMVARLQSLVLECSIDYIHGQEPSAQIEKKMDLFVSGKINVLVCSSIIESGIDVPSANTIIINNAHLFGLSQLYQMRGRVGRSGIQAHAYMIIPKNISLSDKAFKRIRAIEENVSLGSGYGVAFSDMEIRGSGSMFGYSQSGGSSNIGYEMYTQLVQESINTCINESQNKVLPIEVEIRFFEKRIIPKNYIVSENTRLSIYKHISATTNSDLLETLKTNIINRFGPLPAPVNNLFIESKLRSSLSSIGVSSVLRKGCGVLCVFEFINITEYSASLLNYISKYWMNKNIFFHILPTKKPILKACIHLKDNEDNFILFSDFINKFTSWSNS